TRSGEDRVPLRGTVSPRWIHRDQPGNRQPCSGAVLQQAGNGGTMDQRRQAGGQDDAAELPSVPVERSAVMAEPDRLQPGESLAAAGAAEADRKLVADEPAATAGEDRWQAGEACPVLLAAAGGESSDAAVVRKHGAADRGAAGADGVNVQSGRVRIWRRKEAETKRCRRSR